MITSAVARLIEIGTQMEAIQAQNKDREPTLDEVCELDDLEGEAYSIWSAGTCEVFPDDLCESKYPRLSWMGFDITNPAGEPLLGVMIDGEVIYYNIVHAPLMQWMSRLTETEVGVVLDYFCDRGSDFYTEAFACIRRQWMDCPHAPRI